MTTRLATASPISFPEASFHTLFQVVLAQAGCTAIEAVNSYEGRPTADVVCLADGRMDLRYLVVY